MKQLFKDRDILEAVEREPFDGIGTVFGINEFAEDVDCRCITSYDGFGELMIDDQVLVDSYVNVNSKTVSVPHSSMISFESLYMMYGNRAKICWYNK